MQALLFITVSICTGTVLCADHHVPNQVVAGGHLNLISRLEELEKRDASREDERQRLILKIDTIEARLSDVIAENEQLKNDVVNLRDMIDNVHGENKYLKYMLLNGRNGIKLHDQVDLPLSQQAEENNSADLGKNRTDNMPNMPTEGSQRSSIPLSKSDTKERVRKGNGVQRIQRFENEHTVAFYASLTNHLKHVGTDQNIVFNKAVTNVGNAYNVISGDFRPPVDGIYSFSTTIRAHGTNQTHHYFSKNGNGVAKLAVMGNHAPYSSASITVVLKLNTSDVVSVRNVDSDATVNGNYYSVFSGFLLQEDYTSTFPSVIG